MLLTPEPWVRRTHPRLFTRENTRREALWREMNQPLREMRGAQKSRKSALRTRTLARCPRKIDFFIYKMPAHTAQPRSRKGLDIVNPDEPLLLSAFFSSSLSRHAGFVEPPCEFVFLFFFVTSELCYTFWSCRVMLWDGAFFRSPVGGWLIVRWFVINRYSFVG